MKLFGSEHNQKTLRLLHNKGIELTPDELVVERKAAYAMIRREMRAKEPIAKSRTSYGLLN